MGTVYNHKAIATAEFTDPKFGGVRFRLTVTRVNGAPTARFELDGFNGDSEVAVPLYYLSSGTWLDYAASLPQSAPYAAEAANAAQECFKQVMGK